MRGAVLIGVGLVLLATGRSDGQDEPVARVSSARPPDSLRGNFGAAAFDKSLNTYHWTAIARYRDIFGPLSVQLNEQYLSTLIRTDRNLVTDNQSLDLRVRRRLSDNLQLSTYATSFILSDNKGIGISNASSHGVYGGVEVSPMPGLALEPMIGMRFDNQIDQHDKGVSYLLGLTGENLDYNGYLTGLRGSFEVDRIDPRTLETDSAAVHIKKVFFEETSNRLQLYYLRNRRDFYFLADPAIQQQYGALYNIEARTDNSIGLGDSLDYNIGKRMLLSFQGTLFSRQIDRAINYKNFADLRNFTPNTTIDEMRIGASAGATYTASDRLNASFQFSYLERDEKHAVQAEGGITAAILDPLENMEERKNSHSKRTTLSATLAWSPSRSHTFSLTGSGNLLHYDTPSSENDDDRDELSYVAGLATVHRLGESLTAFIDADLNLLHLVYIFSTRSADNTWNRVLRLAPRLLYTPSDRLSSSNSFEVLANYTVYDFEFATALTRSYAFRQFAFVDSTTYLVTRRLALQAYTHLRLYERGEFLWSAFAERPLNDFADKTFIGSLRYTLTPRLLFTVGIRYFSQLRYGYTGSERSLDSYLRSAGPMGAIALNVNGRTDLSITGWYERQSQTGQPDRGLTTMMLLLNVIL